jgi:hypothetical protein
VVLTVLFSTYIRTYDYQLSSLQVCTRYAMVSNIISRRPFLYSSLTIGTVEEAKLQLARFPTRVSVSGRCRILFPLAPIFEIVRLERTRKQCSRSEVQCTMPCRNIRSERGRTMSSLFIPSAPQCDILQCLILWPSVYYWLENVTRYDVRPTDKSTHKSACISNDRTCKTTYLQCFSIRLDSAIFSPISVHAGDVSKRRAASAFTATTLAPVAVEPILTIFGAID